MSNLDSRAYKTDFTTDASGNLTGGNPQCIAVAQKAGGQGAVNMLANAGCFRENGTIDLFSPSNVGTVIATPDVASSNPVIGSGGSRHMQLRARFTW
jgi:hypothetical protein